MPLPAAEHAQVLRETKRVRNAYARSRTPVLPLRGLRLVLPGVVSWARPRAAGSGVRYPRDYTRDRDAWALVVAHGVAASGWRRPPVTSTLCVTAAVVAPGKLDTDRVLTAVLDALQAGGALVDDCRVWQLSVRRRRPQADETPHVDVLLSILEGADG